MSHCAEDAIIRCFLIGDGMRPTRRQILRLTGSLCALAAPPLAECASIGWPNKPIRIIVPGGPGGVTDIRARWLGERLDRPWVSSLWSRTGPAPAATWGPAAAAHSAPDGYTLVIVHIVPWRSSALVCESGLRPTDRPGADHPPGAGPQVLVVHRGVRRLRCGTAQPARPSG